MDNQLSLSEYLFYQELTGLSSCSGLCWAHNNYFSRFFHVSCRTIQRWLCHLEELDLVKVKLLKNKRIITHL
jgi:hypothetical protein